MDKTGEETSGLTIKINELSLFNERSDQELKKAKATKQVQYDFSTLLLQDTFVGLFKTQILLTCSEGCCVPQCYIIISIGTFLVVS